jgi:serine/threonine protein kinase
LALFPCRNVVTVYGLCTDAPDGLLRLVMEYCEGGSLEAFLQTCEQVWSGLALLQSRWWFTLYSFRGVTLRG